MDTTKVCVGCGKPVAADAPQGLCPQCLLKQGLKTEAQSGVGQSAADSFVPPTPAELAPHFPQLDIIELLGQGGMGVVYKARQKQLDRWVALKLMLPSAARDPAFAERFAREARSLARLNHPNIVAVYDFGQAGGYYYFLMEFVDGQNLRQMLEGGWITPKEALAIVPKICEALQFAHEEGIVHRDIKPENLLLDKKGRVKIADFGLAKLVGREPGNVTLTSPGFVMGTPKYMAPEQLERPESVDHRADIYSLGVVFYEMLTGELPLGRFEPPSHKVQVDVRLDEVVLHALEKSPERRYQQASEVKTAVETISATKDATGGSTNRVGSVMHLRFSRKAIMGAGWAAIGLITLFLTVTVQEVRVVESGASPPGPAWWQTLLGFTLLPLGITSPFGTTILGLIGISDIRHSGGRIIGLPLALADALFFRVGRGCRLLSVSNALVHGIAQARLPEWQLMQFTMALGLLLSLIVDFFLVRAAWRAARSPVVGLASASGSGPV